MGQPLIMSFRLDATELCLSGKKTQTRRVREGVRVWGDRIYQTKNGRSTLLWRVGEPVAVRPRRTEKAYGYVKITGLRIERLSSVTDVDAARECVEPPTREGYFDTWRRLHVSAPYRVEDDPQVIVIDFEPAKKEER